MNKVALLPENARQELFSETAAQTAMPPAVVEKDFWVCWVLDKLFSDSELANVLLFKGGTSLSKVFGLIERFSEDIDLILDWRLLTNEEPAAKRSKTKQDALNKQLDRDSGDYVSQELCSRINGLLGKVCDGVPDDNDPHKILLRYPLTFPDSYLRPEIVLEIGPLASWIPHGEYSIRSYAAEKFPSKFEQASCRVKAIKAERTFWEKATILHQEAHRPANKPQPVGYSRHYYDLFCMMSHSVKEGALVDVQLRKDVVAFKDKFYPRAWARYDLAVPGTFRLIPGEKVFKALERDYGDMRLMIYGEYPNFDDIVDGLRKLEIEINQLEV